MSVQAMADTTVSTKADLENAIKAAAGSGQETETVINIAAGSYIRMSNGFEWPLDCNITINGLTDEEQLALGLLVLAAAEEEYYGYNDWGYNDWDYSYYVEPDYSDYWGGGYDDWGGGWDDYGWGW